jgi:hypothetical protein
MAVRASQGRSYSNRKVDQESLPGSDVPLVPTVRLGEFSRFSAAKTPSIRKFADGLRAFYRKNLISLPAQVGYSPLRIAARGSGGV